MSLPTLQIEEPKTIYSKEELTLLDPSKIPKHVAFIMDGNRRWAKKRDVPYAMGHWEGAEVLSDLLKASSELGIEMVTVYAFSTENWGRPSEEVEDLMEIFHLYLIRKKELMLKDGVKLDAIGDLSKLPAKVQEAFFEAKRATQNCQRIQLTLALNYGGRDEICRAVQEIIQKNIPVEKVDEECIRSHLDTKNMPDPELLIRTSGEMRLSNFLLWQLSYAEFISTETLWPDFSPQDLLEAISTFQKRNRRLGG